MTYLLLQTFLLLLASYFLGAFLACTVKRMIFGERHDARSRVAVPMMADAPLRTSTSAVQLPQPIRTRNVPPPVAPRSIDPVQPKIDVIRRPEPRPVPKLVDPSRFERALMGPDPNEGMPRRPIPEIRPAVLKPVTGAYQPGTYGPPSEPEPPPPPFVEVIEPVAVERAFAHPLQEATPQNESFRLRRRSRTRKARQPERRHDLRGCIGCRCGKSRGRSINSPDAPNANAAFFKQVMEKLSLSPDVEPTKIGRPPEEPIETEEPVEDKGVENGKTGEDNEEIDHDAASFEPQDEQRAEDEEPPEDSHAEDTIEADNLAIEPEMVDEEDEEPQPDATPQAVVLTTIEGGDDFQRIRAIDAELEQRLKAEGITSFEHIAAWRAADVQRLSQTLGIPGRIDREQWVEQAQILAKGGETYYSRNRLAALKAATAASMPDIAEQADPSPAETLEESEEPSPPTEAASESADQAIVSEQVPPAAETTAKLSGVASASQGRSVAEMAAAAAAAIAAASASVTRGLKPIEPISPLSKVDPKISIPAKLSDAIKEKEAASTPAVTPVEMEPPRPMSAASHGPSDDLKRIRGVGVLIEKRLNAMGISRYEQIANWTSGDIDRVSQMLEFKGRIEREGWVEQARILLSGGYTEFSRRVDRGEVDTSRET